MMPLTVIKGETSGMPSSNQDHLSCRKISFQKSIMATNNDYSGDIDDEGNKQVAICLKLNEEEIHKENEKDKEAKKVEFSPGIASLENACKTNDEKKARVNGSVIDDLSYESLPFSLKASNFGFVENIDFENKKGAVILLRKCKSDLTLIKKIKNCWKRGFCSSENLPIMFRKNSQDLVNGILSHFTEDLPDSNIRSCTEISNNSQSTSENSINLSRSEEIQNFSTKPWIPISEKDLTNFRNKKKTLTNNKKGFYTPKQSNIADAVTARLYSSKKKSNRHNMQHKEEGKSCYLLENVQNQNTYKGTRMKVFDVKRKMSASRNLKKKVDNNTQTDFPNATVRVKEKSVETDQSLELMDSKKKLKKSNSKINTEKMMVRERNENRSGWKKESQSRFNNICKDQQDKNWDRSSLIQDELAGRNILKNNLNTWQKLAIESEESFSDDSLDSGEIFGQNNVFKNIEEMRKSLSEKGLHENENKNIRTTRSLDSVTEFKEKEANSSIATKPCIFLKIKNLKKIPLFLKTSSSNVFQTLENNQNKHLKEPPMNLIDSIRNLDLLEVTPCESGREDQCYSDNSLASSESFDQESSEETSTEEFIFYKKKDIKYLKNKPELASDRELYIITENSEQSEASDNYSPRKTKKLFEKSFQEKDKNSTSKETMNSQSTGTKSKKFSFCDQSSSEPTPTYNEKCRPFTKSDSSSKKNITSAERKNLFQTTIVDCASTPQITEEIRFPSPDSQVNIEEASLSFPHLREETIVRKNYWKTFESDTKKQFLKFNILDSSKCSSFTVGSQLFKEPPKKDQRTETEFASQDSITLVFMGPAKPKTSVLMEIIRKGLNEKSFAYKKFANKGVQSDSKLMRSISLDSAMIALSRIAKTQQIPMQLSKTKSADFLLSPDEDHSFMDPQSFQKFSKPNPHGNTDEKYEESLENKNLMCSVCGNPFQSRSFDVHEKKNQKMLRKTVSWCGTATSKIANNLTTEIKSQKNNLEERFSPNSSSGDADLSDSSLNYLTSDLSNRHQDETRDSSRESFRPNFPPRRVRFLSIRHEDSNSTWPRRRQSLGKPPPGTRFGNLRTPRPPLPSRFLPFCRDDPWNQIKKMCPLASSEINAANWNSYTSPCKEEKNPNFPSAFFKAFPKHKLLKKNHSKTWVSGTTDLESNIKPVEADLEESCSRLESAVKRDRIRQEILINKNDWLGRAEENFPAPNSLKNNFKSTSGGKAGYEPLKRFKILKCIDACECKASENQLNWCKHICLKTSHSTFELDSFGPGSNHCHHFCMFCRGKNFEIYYSNPVLNTDCESGFCRLDFYGYCPCAPIKLPHISPSPRVYNHQLLKIRQKIVGLTSSSRTTSKP